MTSLLALRVPLVLSAAAFVTGGFTGCATITRGTTEQLTVVSQPSGATVRLSNGFTGVTPATFTIPRKGDLIVSLSKQGYESVDVPVKPGLAGAGTAGFLGNALIGGIIGGGVDIATGATLSHHPNPVNVTLVPMPQPAGEKNSGTANAEGDHHAPPKEGAPPGQEVAAAAPPETETASRASGIPASQSH